MRVTWAGVIKGRGPVVAVDGAPASGLVEGVLVHQGEHSWRVRGVEDQHNQFGGPSKHGLLLRAEPGSPELPELGDLEL